MKNYYQIKGFLKHSEEDIFQDGCQPNSGISHYIDYEIRCEKIDDIIKNAMSFLGINDKKSVLINACDEPGRIDFQVMENSEGCSASDSETNQWKEGKKRLWLCNYSCKVSYISETTDIDLMPLVTNSTDYSTN